MVIILSISSGVIYILTKRILPLRWIMRWMLLAVIGGIIAYIITVFQISVEASWTLMLRSLDIMMITLFGLIVGCDLRLDMVYCSKTKLEKQIIFQP